MISGVVSPAREALVRIEVRGPTGAAREIEAVVDTGFNRYLTLPPALVDLLELGFEAPALATLADGTVTQMDYYRARVLWDNHEREVAVLCSDGHPLIGMSMMYGYTLRIHVVDGGRVGLEISD